MSRNPVQAKAVGHEQVQASVLTKHGKPHGIISVTLTFRGPTANGHPPAPYAMGAYAPQGAQFPPANGYAPPMAGGPGGYAYPGQYPGGYAPPAGAGYPPAGAYPPAAGHPAGFPLQQGPGGYPGAAPYQAPQMVRPGAGMQVNDCNCMQLS